MKNLLRAGISSNMLKTIAIIVMVIDHIGFYFSPFLNETVTVICRSIGRIGIPIFTYLIVQGFFYTKDFKKYILRILICAVVTQLVITVMMVINIKLVPMYETVIYKIINALFAYVISLIILKLLHEDIIIKKWDYHKNLSLKIICICILALGCIVLPLDYQVAIPLLSVLFYYVEKLKITFMMNTQQFREKINKIVKMDEHTIVHCIYVVLLALSILVGIYLNLHVLSIFAIIPIALYNGERGKKSKLLKNVFYCFFPIHHAVLYSLALLIMLT